MKTTYFTLLIGFLILIKNPILGQAPPPDSVALAHLPPAERLQSFIQIATQNANTQPAMARQYAQNALNLAKKLENQAVQIQAYRLIGQIYENIGNPGKALAEYLSGLKLAEGSYDNKARAEFMMRLGMVYQTQKNFAQAERYYAQVLSIAARDARTQAQILNNLGDIYYQQDQYPKALVQYEKSLKIRQQLQDDDGVAVCLKNIGLVYYVRNQYQKALAYLHHARQLNQKVNNQINLASVYSNLADAYQKLERRDSALYFAQQSYELASKLDLLKERMEASFTLADIYALLGDYAHAFGYQAEHLELYKQYYNDQNRKKISDLQDTYELDKKEQELRLVRAQNRFQSSIIYFVGAAMLLLGFIIFLLYRTNQQQLRANEEKEKSNRLLQLQAYEIELQRDEIEKQKQEIEQKNDEISQKNTDIESSIHYAFTIQKAILPPIADIREALPEHFIFYLPRDVVSGDFYWFHSIKNEAEQIETIILAAIDCTGHGIPGAFMSMIGDSILNQIVLDRHITEAALILSELNRGIRKALDQSNTQNRDGMDISLVVIDYTHRTLTYSGARNDFIYLQDRTLATLPAASYPIGGFNEFEQSERVYQAHTLSFAEQPITFYLNSDGFPDQFGGKKGKKYMRTRMKDFLASIHDKPLEEQGRLVEAEFRAWQGSHFQIDDVLLIGARVG